MSNSMSLIMSYSLDILRGLTTLVSVKLMPVVTAIKISMFLMLLD